MGPLGVASSKDDKGRRSSREESDTPFSKLPRQELEEALQEGTPEQPVKRASKEDRSSTRDVEKQRLPWAKVEETFIYVWHSGECKVPYEQNKDEWWKTYVGLMAKHLKCEPEELSQHLARMRELRQRLAG